MSVQRNYLQTVIFDLKKFTGHKLIVFIYSNRKNSLADHFFQCVLRDGQRFILLDHR